MKMLNIAVALTALIAPPAFSQSANEAPRSKSCNASQSGPDYGTPYPGYPQTWCYWW